MKSALGAAAAFGAMSLSSTAMAQVNGIGVVDLPVAVAQSQAFQTGYQQIATQYQAQRTTIDQRGQQRQQLLQTFDSNSDGQIDQTEAAATQDPNNATVRQIQAIDQEIAQLQQPINLARVYVVQQVAQQYSTALQQVVSDRQLQFVMSPDALVYANPAADITPLVVAQLNTRVPAAQITPPAGFQPGDNAVALFQQVQQLLAIASLQQQQGAQQPAAGAGR
ncbi:MAG: OmpH family outer membrane protein [Alteraurantiacibacter sp.]